jgi:uncharacterized protein YgbK (DUF1537 family)
MRIVVIADDLTGALDTGVQFRKWNFDVQFTNTPENSKSEVTITNTDTRNKTPEGAYRITKKLVMGLENYDIIYKKIDSTLRGNPGPEIQAIIDATGVSRVVFTPTYPPTRRKVRDGHLYVGDQPITETDYIDEYLHKTSYIPDILSIDTPIHTVRKISKTPKNGIIVIDSETEKDLQRIAAKYVSIMAGSAGLAEALCYTLRNPPPILAIIGSIRTETRIQLESLCNRLEAVSIPIDIRNILKQASQEKTITDARNALRRGLDVAITSSETISDVEETLSEAKRLDMTSQELEEHITTSLADITVSLVKEKISGIIITGGATALAITNKLGINNIEILDELQPGVPVLKLDDLMTITKAGGFGQQDTLIQATQYLKRRYS